MTTFNKLMAGWTLSPLYFIWIALIHGNIINSEYSNAHSKIHVGADVENFSNIVKLGGLNPYHRHQLVFALRQNNIDQLEEILLDISSPSSPNYGKFMTREEIVNITSNIVACNTLMKYFRSNDNFHVISESLGGEFIAVEANISVWEKTLKTKFNLYSHKSSKHDINKGIVRCEEYTLPLELEDHVSYVFNTVETPFLQNTPKSRIKPLTLVDNINMFKNKTRSFIDTLNHEKQHPNQEVNRIRELKSLRGSSPFNIDAINPAVNNPYPGYINPVFLRSVYSIFGVGSKVSTQTIFETSGNSYSPIDLDLFQSTLDVIMNPVSRIGQDDITVSEEYCTTTGLCR